MQNRISFHLKFFHFRKFILTFLSLSFACTIAAEGQTTQPTLKYFERLLRKYKLDGQMKITGFEPDSSFTYNYRIQDSAFIPASTFKILNSMIAIENGIIPDENFVLKWDRVNRQNEAWNHDQPMKEAFRNSTVWYYQEVARRTGGMVMKKWLDACEYGNADTSGGIDHFWLNGGLRVTPDDQLKILYKLAYNPAPFSLRTQEIVRRIMIEKETDAYTVRAKTGWGFQNGTEVGWFTGWVEKGKNKYFFVTTLFDKTSDNKNFASARRIITYQMLKKSGIL